MEAMRVLVVDDEEELVEALVDRLNLRGVEATGVTSGSEALATLESSQFDVVLLDVKMPGSGGLEVIRKIKENWPGLEVVLLTGHGSSKDAETGMQLGAYDYLQKPVKIEDLMGILLRAAEGKRDEQG